VIVPAPALRVLRSQFLAGSPARLDRIAAELDRLRGDPLDREAFDRLRTEFHGFSGLGGTYGFPAVSALGVDGERRCDALLDSPGEPRPGPEDFARFDDVLRSLRAELATDSAKSGPRILAFSADPARANAIRDVLETTGYTVRLLGGADGSEEAALFRPHLLVLDVDPEKGGRIEAALRAAPDARRVYLGSHPIQPGELLAAVVKGLER
jgi:hypothetical protein